jgi:hypothetical protein
VVVTLTAVWHARRATGGVGEHLEALARGVDEARRQPLRGG